MNPTQLMMKTNVCRILAAVFAILGALAARPAAAQEDSAHDELRALRAGVIEAINKRDLEAMIGFVHPNVVVTWQNNEVCRGRDGLREFYERMGENAFKSYKVEPEPDELTILYGGDTGISFGKSVGAYEILGKGFEFHNRWTATVVKEDGKRLLAAYQVSLNALDNPILNGAKSALYAAAGVGGVIGVVFSFVVFRRKKA